MIEIIWGTALVNAHFLYNLNSVNPNSVNITTFRQSVVSSLLEVPTLPDGLKLPQLQVGEPRQMSRIT